jgi:hypothetical protein
MAKEVFYRQVNLERGTGRMTGYIEERGAVVGKSVEVIADDKNHWIVTQVGDQRYPEAFIRERQKTEIFGSIKPKE